MPEAPQHSLTPTNNAKERQAEADSPAYRGTTTSVRQYMRLPRAEQEALNRECDKRDRLAYREVKPATGPAYQVGYKEGQTGQR